MINEIEQLKQLAAAAAFAVCHEKLATLPPSSAWLWLQGLVIASVHQGLIPEAEVRKLKAFRAVASLVEGGFWRSELGGWRPILLSKATPQARQTLAPTAPIDVVLIYPTVGASQTWPLTRAKVEQWKALYPGLDVEEQCRNALAWIHAKPTHRKTVTGMERFLVSWLTRSTDRRQHAVAVRTTTEARGRTGAPSPSKYDRIGVGDE